MGVHVDFANDARHDFPLTGEEVHSICETVLKEEGVTRLCFVSVAVVDDEKIRELNRDWRGQDRPTDVISLECDRPDDPELAEDEPCELGDIVLAPSYIERQAWEYGTTFEQECTLLLVHGLLHLLGYDHLAEDDAHVMEAREDELVAICSKSDVVAHTHLTRHRGDDVA